MISVSSFMSSFPGEKLITAKPRFDLSTYCQCTPPTRMILIISWEISLFLLYDLAPNVVRFFFAIKSSPERCYEI